MVGLRESYALERELWWIRASGYTALGALFISLSATPLAKLSARLGASAVVAAGPAVRRSFGIAAAVWATGHALATVLTYLDGAWQAIWTWPYVRAGFVAWAILLPLLVTSFPWLTVRLRVRWWKPLHRLVYAAPLFLLLHLLQSPFAPRRRTIVLFTVLLLVATLRLLPRRRPVTVRAG